jgi:hypothetical protein
MRRLSWYSEWIDQRVHVGGGEVVLLVPGRRGQNDVGEQRRRRYPKVGADEQVELSLGNVVAPDHLGGPHLGGRLCRHEVRVGTQQVLEEVLVALSRRAQQVGPPEDQGAWPVPEGVDVLDRELQASVGQPVDDVDRRVGDSAGGGSGHRLVGEVERNLHRATNR